jgi:hypothetical protein
MCHQGDIFVTLSIHDDCSMSHDLQAETKLEAAINSIDALESFVDR